MLSVTSHIHGIFDPLGSLSFGEKSTEHTFSPPAIAALCQSTSALSSRTDELHLRKRDHMWKRSIRHTRLLTRARTTRIVPCCHQYQELAWSSPPGETRTTSLRHAWNWAKIKPDPKNPFFAKRSTKNTPHTAVVLLRNAEVPMLQIQPPVFMPSTSEEGTKLICHDIFLYFTDRLFLHDVLTPNDGWTIMFSIDSATLP